MVICIISVMNINHSLEMTISPSEVLPRYVSGIKERTVPSVSLSTMKEGVFE